MQEHGHESNRLTTVDRRVESEAARAFEEVYLLYGPRLRWIASSKFGVDAGDAEALVHDVFATYLLHASAVRDLERYLVGAICNAARNHLRRGAGRAMYCDEQPCVAAQADGVVAHVERKVLLARMLGCVGSRCRELLRRYYADGETTEAIADAMNTTPGTISVLLHRCRRRARAAYDAMTERH